MNDTNDTTVRTTKLEIQFRIFMKDRKEVEQEIKLFYQSNTIIYYTDGSWFDGKLGTGVVICQNTPDVDKKVISHHLGKFAIVFQTQMFRIEWSAGSLLEMESIGKAICILTENQAFLRKSQFLRFVGRQQ